MDLTAVSNKVSSNGGKLNGLTDSEKLAYMAAMCEKLGLDPQTNPLQIVKLQGNDVLYAGRGCVSQLNQKHNLSHEITGTERIENLYIVKDRCTGNGRSTDEIGAVNIEGLKGDALANAIMKARTKAMRRATLSHVGLGLLDESEIETIPGAKVQADSRDTAYMGHEQLKAYSQSQAKEKTFKEKLDDVLEEIKKVVGIEGQGGLTKEVKTNGGLYRLIQQATLEQDLSIAEQALEVAKALKEAQ
jgi:hypothetical protein